MYRRIHAVYEFRQPDYLQRHLIWLIHTKHRAIPCSADVNFKELAVQFPLSGGFIRNAVQSALQLAIGRISRPPQNSSSPIGATDFEITQRDFVRGCQAQMRASLTMKHFARRKVPTFGFDVLVLPPNIISALNTATCFEKSRSLLFGQVRDMTTFCDIFLVIIFDHL